MTRHCFNKIINVSPFSCNYAVSSLGRRSEYEAGIKLRVFDGQWRDAVDHARIISSHHYVPLSPGNIYQSFVQLYLSQRVPGFGILLYLNLNDFYTENYQFYHLLFHSLSLKKCCASKMAARYEKVVKKHQPEIMHFAVLMELRWSFLLERRPALESKCQMLPKRW